MASGAAHMMFESVFDGSIAANDTDIQWRPYHRNCGCALHKLKGGRSHVCSQPRNVAFPKKKVAKGLFLGSGSFYSRFLINHSFHTLFSIFSSSQ